MDFAHTPPPNPELSNSRGRRVTPFHYFIHLHCLIFSSHSWVGKGSGDIIEEKAWRRVVGYNIQCSLAYCSLLLHCPFTPPSLFVFSHSGRGRGRSRDWSPFFWEKTRLVFGHPTLIWLWNGANSGCRAVAPGMW